MNLKTNVDGDYYFFGLFSSQLVRLIANLSVHAEVGPRIAGDQDTVHFLLMILGK